MINKTPESKQPKSRQRLTNKQNPDSSPSSSALSTFTSSPEQQELIDDAHDIIIPTEEQTSSLMQSTDTMNCKFIYVPNDFPQSSRPIYLLNSLAKITYGCHASEFDKWAKFLDRLIANRSYAGIMHSLSYDRGAMYVQRSSQTERIITHAPPSYDEKFKRKPGEQELHFHKLTDAVAMYKELALAGCGPVIVSPVLLTGYSFPHDECRFIVFMKAPYPNTGTKLMKVRAMLDKFYIPNLVSQDLQQGGGRGFRSKDDWCEVFIVDVSMMSYCYGGNYRSLLPPDFAIKYWKEYMMPAPMKGKS